MSIDFPKEEERILARWKEIDAFLRQVELVRSIHNHILARAGVKFCLYALQNHATF
jgi:hypothetical protein